MPASPDPALTASVSEVGPRWMLWYCPACEYVGLEGVTGGVGPWPGDGKVRCPSSRCEYRTVMEPKGALAPAAEVDRLHDAIRDHQRQITEGYGMRGGPMDNKLWESLR